ncbi:MAG: hypothetical protein MAG471_00895 [Acidimicrobiaceae bacterium]|nr:hypothetical protein [Acidimicrobiaceae bacterium]
MVELHDEGDPVGEPSGNRSQHTEGGGDRVAAALDCQFNNVGRVEVGGIGCKRCRRRVFDALVDREYRHVAGSAQATVVKERLDAAQHLWRPVGLGQHVGDIVGARTGQQVGRDSLRLVFQQVGGIAAQQVLEFHLTSPGS